MTRAIRKHLSKILSHSPGTTEDGVPVINGVFKLVGTYGMPLETILMWLENFAVIDWRDYIKSALSDGHKIETIKARISAAIAEIKGKQYAIEFEKRLNLFCSESA